MKEVYVHCDSVGAGVRTGVVEDPRPESGGALIRLDDGRRGGFIWTEFALVSWWGIRWIRDAKLAWTYGLGARHR